MDEWVKMPTKWILNKDNPPLKQFTWRGEDKSNYIAALILYLAICHHANRNEKSSCKIGCAKLSYTKLNIITSLSRAKIAAGVSILEKKDLIIKDISEKTNSYCVVNYSNRGGWAKLPAKHLYNKKHEHIKPFMEFKLRQKVELDSLKLYLLLIALRDNYRNHAYPKYETISAYTGIPRGNIRSAISILVNHDMVHVQKYGELEELEKRNNIYRIIGIDGNKHAGNTSYDKMFQIYEKS